MKEIPKLFLGSKEIDSLKRRERVAFVNFSIDIAKVNYKQFKDGKRSYVDLFACDFADPRYSRSHVDYEWEEFISPEGIVVTVSSVKLRSRLLDVIEPDLESFSAGFSRTTQLPLPKTEALRNVLKNDKDRVLKVESTVYDLNSPQNTIQRAIFQRFFNPETNRPMSEVFSVYRSHIEGKPSEYTNYKNRVNKKISNKRPIIRSSATWR